jgi:large subunit ribosomal protein L9
MELILKQDIPSLGQAGDIVKVKSGYGSNYLIPQGLAVRATAMNKSQLEHERRAIEASIVRERRSAVAMSAKLKGLSITITRLVGDEDKIFGSVTTKDIAEALDAEGVSVDRRAVKLDAPLRALGVYDVPVKLHRDVETEVKVWVVAD